MLRYSILVFSFHGKKHPSAWLEAAAHPGPMRGLGAIAYEGVQRLRSMLYARGYLRQRALQPAVISVGGIEVGGTGKTPVAAYLLAQLLSSGRRPGLLTRGYRRRSRGLALRCPGEAADPAHIGDEPAMLLLQGLDIHVAACASRYRGGEALVQRGCDVLVLDDGFAHQALKRDLNIVVLRGEAPFGNHRLLPSGTLREPPAALARATHLWLHCQSRIQALRLADESETGMFPERPRIVSVGIPGPLCNAHDMRPLEALPHAVIAACGLARPQNFFSTLQMAEVPVLEASAFPDHYDFKPADIATLCKQVERKRASAVVVTEKDAVKLRRLWPITAPPLLVMPLSLEIVHGPSEIVLPKYNWTLPLKELKARS